MRKTQLGTTGLTVSAVCMGTVNFGTTVDARAAFETLDRFADYGGNFLDTAAMYANWVPGCVKSASEKTIGKWLQARRAWDSMLVETKGGAPDEQTDVPMLSAQQLARQIEESRRNLGLDCLPLYVLHRDDVRRPVEEIMDALFEAVLQGRIAHIGCSNWRAERIIRANAYAQSCGQRGFEAVSNRWSLAKMIPGTAEDPALVDMDDALYAMHCADGIAAMPYTSTAQGYLSKLAAGKPMSAALVRCYGTKENGALAARAQELAACRGLTVAQLALCSLYMQPFSVTPVTAFSTEEQMREAAEATHVMLTREEMEFLLAGRRY